MDRILCFQKNIVLRKYKGTKLSNMNSLQFACAQIQIHRNGNFCKFDYVFCVAAMWMLNLR